MTGKCCGPLFLLRLTAVVIGIIGHGEAVEEDALLVRNLTDKLLQVIPQNKNNASVTALLIERNLITLNETDRQALATYPTLVELHVDANRVTTVPAKYFSVLPRLRVLSLARNNISSLDPEVLSGLDALQELDLSNNELTNLPTHLITGLKHLQRLQLQDNPWNCSCQLQSTVGKMRAANISFGSPQLVCTSPAEQAGNNLLNSTDLCSTSTPPHLSVEPQKTTLMSSQLSHGSSATLKSSSQSYNTSQDQTPVLGNTWKFTACVAALALITSVLIVSAIKGPSWYKRFHNYRHRRLHQDDNQDGEESASTNFSGERRYQSHQTFSFEQHNERVEEEDDYFEDPYIKREE
ncbi:leucine-rich repeat-containing protein 19-like isoform X2 [Cololabis saira]|nr:leucine-rich repeat-containing protein 19-like isoform X2 [Cololabis saira]